MTAHSGYHSNRWYKKHPEAERPEPRREMVKKPESSKSPVLGYLRATGFVSLVLAIGALLIEPYFWWFVVFMYVGLLIALVDCWLEKPLGGFKYVMSCFFLAVICIFTVGVVWPRFRPDFVAIWNRGDYASGSDIAGMKWQDGWSELRLSISNKYDVEMKDVEMEFLVEEPVADIKLASSLPCSIVLIGASPLGQPYMTDSSGKQTLLGEPSFHDGPYRLLCDKLPSHTSVGLLLALNDARPLMNALLNHQKVVNLISPKRKPLWVRTRTTFKAGMRPYILEKTIEPE